MDRLTFYDEVADCYKIYPDAPQGQVIQRLGKYESLEGIKLEVLRNICVERIENLLSDIDNEELREYKGYLEARLNVYKEIVTDIKVLLGE